MLLRMFQGGKLRPDISWMLLMILLQPAAALNGVQPAAALNGVQLAAALNGVQPAAALNGVQPAAALNGVQPAAALNGVQPAAALNGVQPAAALNGVQPAAALNSVGASPAEITTPEDSPSTPYIEDGRLSKCCAKSAEESSRTVQRSHPGVDTFTHFPHKEHEHIHPQGGGNAPPSTPTLATASRVIPFFISQHESPESASKEVALVFSRVFTATSPSPRQENLADYNIQRHDNANKRMGKPLQLNDSQYKQGQAALGTTNQEKIRIPGFVPVTSIWNHHLQFVPENTPVPVESVSRSMDLHFGGKPLNFSTEEKNNEPNLSPIGGIGNPGLLGVPISLGNSNTYIVPSENMATTPDSIYGGMGDDVPQRYPLKFGGSFNTSSSQKLVSIRNQSQFQYPPVSHVSHSSSDLKGSNTWNYAPEDVADTRPSLQPPAFNQLLHVMQQSITENSNEQNYFSLLTSSPVSPDSLFPSTFGSQPIDSEDLSSSLSPTQISLPTDPSYNPIQLLQQYYQYYEASDPSNLYEEPQYPQNDQITPDVSYLENVPNYFGDAAYVPAFDSPASPPGSPGSPSDLPQSPDAAPSLPIALTPTSTSTSASGCLASTLCSLGMAIALALGATSAFYIPFLGRRRRSIDHIILSQDNAHEFLNNYINYIKNGTLNNSGSENFFMALHDSTDNSTRKLFRKLEQFIIRNKDKLLNITVQEIQLKEHIPIPKEILESISKINGKQVNEPGERGVSEEAYTRTDDTAHGPDHMSSLLPDGIHSSAMSSKLSVANTEDSTTEYGHDTEYSIILQHEEADDSAGVAVRPSTGNYHASFSNNPFYARPGTTLVGTNVKLYASNYLHPPEPVNTQHSQDTPAFRHPPRDRYPSLNPGYLYPPAHTHGSSGADILLVSNGVGEGGHGGSPWRERAGFYRTVCDALHHPHTPHNEIIKFIASKCYILQHAGVI